MKEKGEIRIIDGALLIVILTWSFIIITIASWKYIKSQKSNNYYKPLLSSNLPTTTTYGSTTTTDNNDQQEEEKIEIKSSRWTLFNLSRFLLSVIQFGLFFYFIIKIRQQKYEFSINEGSKFDILISYGTHLLLWVSFYWLN